MEPAFSVGARGMIVRDLQAAIGGIGVDGIYGTSTAAAVRAIQRRAGMRCDGRAGARLFTHLGLEWPSEFLRCAALTACFEGASFGACNSTDIDGAGFTFGCLGFTTASGEAQELLSGFARSARGSLAVLPAGLRNELLGLAGNPASERSAWEKLLFDPSGRVRNEIAKALAAWGSHPEMRRLQLAMGTRRFWTPAVRCAESHGLRSMAARGLFFDLWVQNGCWRADHEKVWRQRMRSATQEPDECSATREPDERSATHEPELLEAVAYAAANLSARRWRADVLARKLVFARSCGTVHGQAYSLACQGFER